MIGNANVGKTTLFNSITASNNRTGNWDGVTATNSEFKYDTSQKFLIADTPGVFSVHELVCGQPFYQWILQQELSHIIQVIDLKNLRKELCLTQQLLLLSIPLVLVTRNKKYVEESSSIKELLEENFPVQVIDESQIHQLADLSVLPQERSSKIDNPQEMLAEEMDALHGIKAGKVGSGLLALLEERYLLAEKIGSHIKVIKQKKGLIERLIVKPVMGIVIFLLMIFTMFSFTVGVGGAMSEFIHTLSESFLIAGPQKVLQGQNEWLCLIILGAGRGVQLALDFISPLFILYFCLRAMEQSGYSARVALLMDRHFRRLGLSGRTFLPLLMGLGCNVPAIVATRILPRSEQIKAALMMPFMTCSARLTTYVAIIAVYFPVSGPWVLFFLYVMGFVIALLTAYIAKKSRMLGPNTPLVMQVPALKWRFKFEWLKDAFHQSMTFFYKLLWLIIPGSICIHLLLHCFADDISSLAPIAVAPFMPIGFTVEQFPAALGIISGLLAKEMVIATMVVANKSQLLLIDDPVWGFELINSAFMAFQAALYHLYEVMWHPSLSTLGDQFGFKLGGIFSSPKQALSFLVFISLYFPCISTMGALSEVVGSRYMLYTAAWSILVAYLVSSIIYWAWFVVPISFALMIGYLAIPTMLRKVHEVSLRLRDYFAGDWML